MSSWLDSVRRGWNPMRRSQSDITVGRPVRAGDPGVSYDDNGRLYYQGDSPGEHRTVTSSLPRDKYYKRQMRPDDTFTYDPRKTHSDIMRGETPRSSGRGHVIATKHYDSYKHSPHLDGRMPPRGEIVTVGVPVPNGYYQTDRKPVREGSIILEERIVSHERPWIWPLYLITGLIMFAAGIVNIMFCVDQHMYVYLWVPIFLVVFAITGAFHKGVYRGSKGRSRNLAYIIIGILTTIAVVVCCAFVQIRLNHVTIQISEHGPQGFINYEADRMIQHNELPRINLTTTLDGNIWACYSIDWVGLILSLVSFTVLSSVVVIGNNYYNSNNDYHREVDPFCRPCLFNPWSQITASQVMVFFGIVMKTSIHGNYQIRWQDYWLPVWGAAFPMIAGVLSAIALKRVGLRNGKSLVAGAVFMELLSILLLATIVGLTSYSLYENILAFQPGPIATTVYSQRLLTASVILLVVMDIVLLIGLIYALALFIRVIIEGCRKPKRPSQDKRYYAEERYGEDRYPGTIERDERFGREYMDGVNLYRDDVMGRF